MITPIGRWLALGVVLGGLTLSPVAAAPAVTQSTLRLPAAPTHVTATATDGQAVVSWTAPRTGGATISRYVIRSSASAGTFVVEGGQTRALLNGLTDGEPLRFTVAAAGSNGQGPSSLPSNTVTPASVSAFTSTVRLRSIDEMFNGGACVDEGSQCFGIQQNSFVHSPNGANYWVQNVVFLEDTLEGWVAEGNYEIWDGAQQSILACSGPVLSGPHGSFCQWPMAWHTVRFPARITLASTVVDGSVVLTNSLGDLFPAWSPGPGGVQDIVDPHEATVSSLLSMYAPETVLVGETGRHNVTFIGGSGSIASQMVLTTGQQADLATQCVAQSSDTSTGESSVGFYWSTITRAGASVLDFAAHGGEPGDGDGAKVLPGAQVCV